MIVKHVKLSQLKSELQKLSVSHKGMYRAAGVARNTQFNKDPILCCEIDAWKPESIVIELSI